MQARETSLRFSCILSSFLSKAWTDCQTLSLKASCRMQSNKKSIQIIRSENQERRKKEESEKIRPVNAEQIQHCLFLNLWGSKKQNNRQTCPPVRGTTGKICCTVSHFCQHNQYQATCGHTKKNDVHWEKVSGNNPQSWLLCFHSVYLFCIIVQPWAMKITSHT